MKESFSVSIPRFKGSPEQFAQALALLERRIVESNIVRVYEETAVPIVKLIHKPEESTPTFQLLLGEKTFLTGAAGGTNLLIMRTLRGAFMSALSAVISNEEK